MNEWRSNETKGISLSLGGAKIIEEWRNTLRPQVEARQYVPANRDSLERFRERMKARAREVGARIPGDANPIRKPVWD